MGPLNEIVDREEYDHGTDVYVSDCNRLPFEKPFFKGRTQTRPSARNGGSAILGGGLLLLALIGGGIWGGFLLVGKLMKTLLE